MLENIIIITIVVQWCWFLYVLLQQKRINNQMNERVEEVEKELLNIGFLNLESEQRRQWKFNTKARKEILYIKSKVKVLDTFTGVMNSWREFNENMQTLDMAVGKPKKNKSSK